MSWGNRFRTCAALAVLEEDLLRPKWLVGDYKFLSLRDNENEKTASINKAIEQGCEFIQQHISSGVVVYCGCGVSRSATIVIAYLISQNCWEYFKAFDFVKEKRGCVQPNAKFVKVLQKMGEMNRKEICKGE